MAGTSHQVAPFGSGQEIDNDERLKEKKGARNYCLESTVATESKDQFWKSARQVLLTKEDQGSQRVNGKSTRAQTCTGTLLDVAKDLEGRY